MPSESQAAWLLRTYDRARRLGLQEQARSVKHIICRMYGINPKRGLRLVAAANRLPELEAHDRKD